MPEISDKETSIDVAWAIRITRSDVIVFSQYDGAVRGVIHPPSDSGFGGIICTGSRIDDFPSPSSSIPCAHFPVPITGSIRTGMGKEIIHSHVQTVDSRRNLKGIIVRQGSEAGIVTFIVD
jgi:hypothetical protein